MQVKQINNWRNKKYKRINKTYQSYGLNHTFQGFSSYQHKSRCEFNVCKGICLLKACNREKRTMIRYVTDQEDGQTARTDYTDTEHFLRKGD